MSTSEGEAQSSLVRAIERMTTKARARAEELARRTEDLERRPPRSRHRTWCETKEEILGRYR